MVEPDRLVGAGPRRERMLAARREGQTLQQIGERWGVSRERVRQILGQAGALRAAKRASARRYRRRSSTPQRSSASGRPAAHSVRSCSSSGCPDGRSSKCSAGCPPAERPALPRDRATPARRGRVGAGGSGSAMSGCSRGCATSPSRRAFARRCGGGTPITLRRSRCTGSGSGAGCAPKPWPGCRPRSPLAAMGYPTIEKRTPRSPVSGSPASLDAGQPTPSMSNITRLTSHRCG